MSVYFRDPDGNNLEVSTWEKVPDDQSTPKEDVDQAYRAVLEAKERYEIGEIIPPAMHHGVYSMYLHDMNGVWWEIEYYDGILHDDFFDLGDQYDADGQPLNASDVES